ncbi:MAG: hypothetical protein KTR21_02935 [Rhodobacteraceae bacterium]|nr:hypothetical protein [Paracoccaceae bacterium]
MKSTTFSVTPILMTSLFAGALAGAIIGAILASLGVQSWILAALCGILPGFVVNPIRTSMAQGMADLVDKTAPEFMVSWQSCIGVSVVASLIASYFIIGFGGIGVGFLGGALIGLLSGAVISIVMTLRRPA